MSAERLACVKRCGDGWTAEVNQDVLFTCTAAELRDAAAAFMVELAKMILAKTEAEDRSI